MEDFTGEIEDGGLNELGNLERGDNGKGWGSSITSHHLHRSFCRYTFLHLRYAKDLTMEIEDLTMDSEDLALEMRFIASGNQTWQWNICTNGAFNRNIIALKRGFPNCNV